MNQFFTSDGQRIGVSAPMNIQDWFPWGWTGWISLQFKGLSVFSSTKVLVLTRMAGPTSQFWFSRSGIGQEFAFVASLLVPTFPPNLIRQCGVTQLQKTLLSGWWRWRFWVCVWMVLVFAKPPTELRAGDGDEPGLSSGSELTLSSDSDGAASPDHVLRDSSPLPPLLEMLPDCDAASPFSVEQLFMKFLDGPVSTGSWKKTFQVL